MIYAAHTAFVSRMGSTVCAVLMFAWLANRFGQ